MLCAAERAWSRVSSEGGREVHGVVIGHRRCIELGEAAATTRRDSSTLPPRVEVVVVVSHNQRIGCQPDKNYFTRWPIPLV